MKKNHPRFGSMTNAEKRMNKINLAEEAKSNNISSMVPGLNHI